MYELRIDYTKCKDVGKCMEIFPAFRVSFGGYLHISQDAPEDRDYRGKALEICQSCPNNAIIFKLIR